MDSDTKDPRHFLKKAANIVEASCYGCYMDVSIEKALVNVPITGHLYSESKNEILL
jgi:hypothetical protein